jgi:hypothetical protein
MSFQGSEKFNLEHGRNVMSPSAIIWKDGMLQPSPGASTLLKVDVCIVLKSGKYALTTLILNNGEAPTAML